MKQKSKIIIAAAVVTALAAGAVVTVFAYLQSTVEQPNKFKIGEDKVRVTEVFTEPTTMSMTNDFEKRVEVQNNGTSDQFVRVYLDFSDSRVRDKSKLVYTKNGVTQEADWSGFLQNLPDNWAYMPDTDAVLGGYFYYTKIVKPNETTPPLIERVKTDFTDQSDPDNTDNITDFDVIVYTESVQTTEINANGKVYQDSEWQDAWRSFLQ